MKLYFKMIFIFLSSLLILSCNPDIDESIACVKSSLEPGEYSEQKEITLSCETNGVTIYYTLNNEEPTVDDFVYSSPILLDKDLTIKSIAIKDGYLSSAMTIFNYTLKEEAAESVKNITFSVTEGTYNSDITVSLTSETENCSIYYTLNNEEPTSSSTLYSSPIEIKNDGAEITIKAIGIKDGMNNSSVSSSSYKIEYFTITFNSNQGTNVSSIKAPKDSTISSPSNPTRDGYSFINWYKEDSLTNVWNFSTDKVTENTTLFAKWEILPPNEYKVSFNTNGGSVISDITQEENEKITAPVEPVKDGYTFIDWYKEDSYTNKWNFSTDVVTMDTTLFAKYSAINYDITYNLNDGTNAANPATYTVETDTITLLNPTKTNYTFNGWYTTDDFSDSVVTSIAQGSTGNKVFYAKFTPITYSITYNLNDGTNAANPATYTVETDTITLLNPTKTNYTFNGWYTTDDFSDSVVTSIAQGSTGNKVFYAKFSPNQTVGVTIEGTVDKTITIIGLQDTYKVGDTMELSVAEIFSDNDSDYKWNYRDEDYYGRTFWGKSISINVSSNDIGTQLFTLLIKDTDGQYYSKNFRVTITN
ncbi:hypothetical protein EW093_12795 [Thiospirochaeta perfilievii]|uniref:GH29D-like beta-sandwich domain-containing protein n=1 Tax=Thiospirochaeta perfilievii TaxID=252967 RepID=A0A5C1QG92_9SPIO|nr:InlB B-repeat-containing protein [Thiospirochaeta perfilievii]QEN05556.1 hypothetical protein EW093_12795 [Thiospirochaeta perfilievii]